MLDIFYRIVVFKVLENHEKLSSKVQHHFPKTFSFESSIELLDFYIAQSRILYFWQFLESIPKFIIQFHALQCLFLRGSNKQQRRGRTISISQKDRLFIFYENQVLLGVIFQSCLVSCTLQETLSSPLHFR